MTKNEKTKSHLIEEDLSLAQNMLQLGQLQEVSFQRLSILVDFTQLILELLKGRLQVDHLTRLRRFRTLAGIVHWNSILFDLLLEISKLSLHLVASTHLIDELALESVDVGIQVTELNETELAELRNASVCSFALEKELTQGHFLATK